MAAFWPKEAKLRPIFRVLGEAAKMFMRVAPVTIALPNSVLIEAVGSSASKVYGRFMGGSDRNTSNSGHLGQAVQYMQIAQSRIKTSCFACC
jgi:hypothetical protein